MRGFDFIRFKTYHKWMRAAREDDTNPSPPPPNIMASPSQSKNETKTDPYSGKVISINLTFETQTTGETYHFIIDRGDMPYWEGQ